MKYPFYPFISFPPLPQSTTPPSLPYPTAAVASSATGVDGATPVAGQVPFFLLCSLNPHHPQHPPLSGTPAYLLLCFSSMTSTPQERRRKKQEPATTASPSPPLKPPSPPPVTATSSLFFSFTTVPKSHRKPHLRPPPRAT